MSSCKDALFVSRLALPLPYPALPDIYGRPNITCMGDVFIHHICYEVVDVSISGEEGHGLTKDRPAYILVTFMHISHWFRANQNTSY